MQVAALPLCFSRRHSDIPFQPHLFLSRGTAPAFQVYDVWKKELNAKPDSSVYVSDRDQKDPMKSSRSKILLLLLCDQDQLLLPRMIAVHPYKNCRHNFHNLRGQVFGQILCHRTGIGMLSPARCHFCYQ